MKIKGKRLSGYLVWLKKGISNPKLLIFVFFLFVSVVFWLINSLSEKYTGKISYPVKFVNISKNKVLLTNLPEQITIHAESFGFSLLKAKLNAGLKPVIIDFNKYYLIQSEDDTNRYLLNTDNILDDIEKQLQMDMKIKDISPDSIFLQYTKRSSKKIPVNLNLMLDYKKPFMREGEIIVQPDSVTISGPYTILDTIRFVETEYMKISSIEDTQQFSLELIPIEHISFSQKSVNITIPVEQFTEFELNVPINVLNKPQGVDVKLFPNTIKIKCLVALSNYKKIDKKDFKVVVDYDSINNNEKNKLEVTNIASPDYIKQYKYSPEHVEYIIEK